jgi:hypothetical protein
MGAVPQRGLISWGGADSFPAVVPVLPCDIISSMTPTSRRAPVVAVIALLVVAVVVLAPTVYSGVRLPKLDYRTAILENGLTVVMSEDYATQIVHVELWSRVGSKNERLGSVEGSQGLSS